MTKSIILALIVSVLSLKTSGQKLIELPSPLPFDGPENGYMGNPVTFQGSFYGQYGKSAGNYFALVKYDSAGLTEIISPVGSNYIGSPIVFNGNLYLRYEGRNDRNFDLCKFDGIRLSLIQSPSGYDGGGSGYWGYPIIYNSNLYLQYTSNEGHFDLFKLEGDTVKKVAIPQGKQCQLFQSFILNNSLFLLCKDDSSYTIVKFDGNSFTEILSQKNNSPNGNWSFHIPITFKNKIYSRIFGSNGIELLQFDGDTVTKISSPIGFQANLCGYTGYGFVHDTVLYLQYKGNDGNFDLFKFDGVTLTQIASPPNYDANSKGYQGDAVALGPDLYLRYTPNKKTSSTLFKYNGNNLIEIPSTIYNNNDGGYIDNPIILEGVMYMRYRQPDGTFDLVKFDGSVFTPIPTPSSYNVSTGGYHDKPFISGKDLFMRYKGNDGNYDLFRLTYDPLVGFKESGLEQQIILYPNPTTSKLIVDPNGFSESFKITVRDMLGRIIGSYNITNRNNFEFEIQGSPGLYLVEVKTENFLFVKKIIKE